MSAFKIENVFHELPRNFSTSIASDPLRTSSHVPALTRSPSQNFTDALISSKNSFSALTNTPASAYHSPLTKISFTLGETGGTAARARLIPNSVPSSPARPNPFMAGATRRFFEATGLADAKPMLDSNTEWARQEQFAYDAAPYVGTALAVPVLGYLARFAPALPVAAGLAKAMDKLFIPPKATNSAPVKQLQDGYSKHLAQHEALKNEVLRGQQTNLVRLQKELRVAEKSGNTNQANWLKGELENLKKLHKLDWTKWKFEQDIRTSTGSSHARATD